jgi:ribosomal-protein-alanine N-acetyltransferase
MTAPFLDALVRGDFAAAGQQIDAYVPPWLAAELGGAMAIWLDRWARDPSAAEWMARSMVLSERGRRRVVGSVGFHGPPGARGTLEVGYSVDPPYRRQGYARESVIALFDWAHERRGIGRFVASISPDNEPSLALARQLGFQKVGEHTDEVDGLEYVFETTWPRPASQGHGEGT